MTSVLVGMLVGICIGWGLGIAHVTILDTPRTFTHTWRTRDECTGVYTEHSEEIEYPRWPYSRGVSPKLRKPRSYSMSADASYRKPGEPYTSTRNDNV